MAQRLVRTICRDCKETFEMDKDELDSLGLTANVAAPIVLHRVRGCQKCRGSGYVGLTAIHEVLPVTEPIKRMTVPGMNLETIRKVPIGKEW